MNRETRVAIRDFAIFMLKLTIDGMKDVVLIQGAVVTLAFDLIFRVQGDKRLFYKLMNAGERFDLWLNLHGRSQRVRASEDGLFGASKAGEDTLLGQLEQLTRGGDEPRGSREPEDPVPPL